MQISIVLLTDRHPGLTRQCLEHIRKNGDVSYELIVLANGPDRGSITYLRQQKDVQLVVSSKEQGIARGYNQGLQKAKGEYVLLMNQYSLLSQFSVGNMLKCLQSEEKAALVGPVSNEVSGYQNILKPYQDLKDMAAFADQNRIVNAGRSRRVFRLLSHCLLAKKELLDKVGGFDERFGLGTFEDDDLCLRLVKAGYSLYIALDAFVHYIDPLSLPGSNSEVFYKRLQENRQKAADKWGFDIGQYLHNLKVPIRISLCLIVKDEEDVLARCLDSVREAVDEIIIVDTGSTDRTREIAQNYTQKIYDFPWIDDFAAARNFAFEKAKFDYILWLDADDVILEDDLKKLLNLKQNMDIAIDSVTMNYNLAVDQYGNVTTSLRRNRLVRRSGRFQWIGAVHEYLAVYGNIFDSDIAVIHRSEKHDSERNLMIYEKRLANGEVFNARDQYYYANELLDHQRIDQAVIWYEKFLEGGEGWVEDNLSACKKLTDCFHTLGDLKSAEKYIFKSFLYDTPRAEFCCRLGYHFQLIERYDLAAFWYKLASQLKRPLDNRGFAENASWTWVPHLQLCVCYDKLGQYDLAYHHNEMAAAYIPDDPNILHNREYLNKRLGLG